LDIIETGNINEDLKNDLSQEKYSAYDILQFNDLSQFSNYLSRKISNIKSKASFEKVRRTLYRYNIIDKTEKLPLNHLTCINTLYVIRNSIVHNSGIVDEECLANYKTYPDQKLKLPSIGNKISLSLTDTNYLEQGVINLSEYLLNKFKSD
jgi:hypothetical protein